MPKVLKKGAARIRKEKFTQDELQVLVDTLHEHADIVFCSDMRRPTILRKKETWELVAQRVSAVGNTPRSTTHCRKRWDDLRLRVRAILSANRQQALETGGGPGSPIKMMPWEETCAEMMGTEAIEGVGEMDCGDPSSADAGSGHESEEQEGSRPSTTRGRGRVQRIPAGRHKAHTTPPAPATPMEGTQPPPAHLDMPAVPPETCPTLHPEESSMSGENAAMCLLSVPDSPTSNSVVNVEETNDYSPESPSYSQVAHSDSGSSDGPGLTGEGVTPVSHQPTSPAETPERPAGPIPSLPTTSPTSAAEAVHSQNLTAMIEEFLRDNRESGLVHHNDLQALGEVITTGTNRLCEVLGRIADALEAATPRPQPQQEEPPSQCSSTQTSPVRRSQRSMRK